METIQIIGAIGLMAFVYAVCVLLSASRTRDYAHGISTRLEAHAAGLEAYLQASSLVRKSAASLRARSVARQEQDNRTPATPLASAKPMRSLN